MSDTKFIYTTALDKIRHMKGRKKVIQGGTSAGKTFSILPILIDKAIKTPNLEISVVSESVPHLRRGALKDFLKIMQLTKRYIPNQYNKSYLKYEFTNGSYIEFFSVEDEGKLRGARRNILYVNEANNIPYEAYLQLSIRTDGDIFIDFNPTNRFWAHTEVLNEPDAEHIILTYKDNEALSEEVIRTLEANREKAKTSSYWANWCNVYLDGQNGNLEGLVFSDWDAIDTIPDESTLIGYGMDFGFTNDPTTCVAVYKVDSTLILDEVIYRKGLSNSEISDLLKEFNVRGEIIADSAEPKSISELRKYGHKIKGAKKGKDSILYGISVLQNYEIRVTKRSLNLKEELNKYYWLKDREGNQINKPVDAFNHAIDAVRYLAMMKLGKRTNNTKPFKIF